MVSAGVAMSDFYKKLFILDISNRNGPLYPKTQSAETFLNFDINYFFNKEIWVLKPIVGFGYCPQGFIEKGVMYNDSQKLVDYIFRLKQDYISVYGGFSYKIVIKKWINLKFTQTINPMLDINKSNNLFRKINLSTKSNLIIDIKFKNGGVACISPFFQTCIFKFNKINKIAGSPNYLPYSYGLNIGTYFKH